jgi:hypothetical protein
MIIMPAATADPMTPATLGPIACISRILCGLASSPTLFATLAAIGTADTPAAPISGLIGCLDTAFNTQRACDEKLVSTQFRANSQAEKYRDDVDQRVLRRVRETLNDSALAHQVAKGEHAD